MNLTFSKILEAIDEIGWQKHRYDLIHNAKNYKARLDRVKKVGFLRGCLAEKPTIIVSAGPSLVKERTLEELLLHDRDSFNLVCIDASLIKLLKNGVIPDYCVVLDPHPTRMLRWFGDPNFSEHMQDDDYFSRQDLDAEFRNTSLELNQENIQIVNKFGPSVSLIFSSCLAPSLYDRLIKINFKDYYGFTPLVDDPDHQKSLTRQLHQITELNCLNTGGNVGCCAWVFSEFIGLSKKIGAIGFDYSYYKGTPFHETQTYTELLTLCKPSEIDQFFIHSKSRDGREFFQDPTFYWYCDNFLSLLANSPNPLYNLSNAGLLYGNNIIAETISDFLDG